MRRRDATVPHAFLCADMRCSHEGLIKIAADKGVKWELLKEGEVLIFINGSKDRLKTLSWSGVLCYLNLEGKGKIDLDAIQQIARAFKHDGRLNYKKALGASLKEKLGEKRFTELEML